MDAGALDDLHLHTWDWDIQRAARAVWQRLPFDVRRALAGVKVYSAPNLTLDGVRVFGYARQSTQAIYICEGGPMVARVVLDETIVHELAHIYLGRVGADYLSEEAVKALIVRWGFAHERWLGRALIGD